MDFILSQTLRILVCGRHDPPLQSVFDLQGLTLNYMNSLPKRLGFCVGDGNLFVCSPAHYSMF